VFSAFFIPVPSAQAVRQKRRGIKNPAYYLYGERPGLRCFHRTNLVRPRGNFPIRPEIQETDEKAVTGKTRNITEDFQNERVAELSQSFIAGKKGAPNIEMGETREEPRVRASSEIAWDERERGINKTYVDK